MADEVLKLQTLSVEEETDEVDGMRFSTTSLSWCGNWSMMSVFGCLFVCFNFYEPYNIYCFGIAYANQIL